MPSTSLSILFFLALVTPGLVFEMLTEARRSRAKESTFREVSRVVLASFVFTSVALLALLLVQRVAPAALPDPGQWLRTGNAYASAHYLRIFLGLAVHTAVACTLAYLTYRLVFRKDATRLSNVSAWTQTFRIRNPTKAAPRVRVRMKSGQVFVGLLGDYTASPVGVAERELVLYSPLFTKATADAELMALPPQMHALVLAGAETESIAVTYRNKGTGDPDTWDEPDRDKKN